MRRKLWSIVTWCEREGETQVANAWCWAVSEAEAIGLAVVKSRERYPRDLGWSDHQALATEIPWPEIEAELKKSAEGSAGA